MARTVLFLCVALWQCACAIEAFAAKQPRPGPSGTHVERFLVERALPELHPEADRIGEVEGEPPAIPLYKGDELLGYAFDTWDVTKAVGYSRKPFHILAAFDLEGRLTGTRLAWHVEPITLLGRDDDDLRDYLAQFVGHDVRSGLSVTFDGAVREGTASSAETQIDGVSRITTSSMLFADAVVRGARMVARPRGIELVAGASNRRLEVELFEEQTWPRMVEDGSLATVLVRHGDIAALYADHGGVALPAAHKADQPDAAYLELTTALVNPAGIGINLLGRRGYRRYAVGRSLADSAIFVASRGDHPVLTLSEDPVAPFPALQVTQGALTVRLTEDRFEPIQYFDLDSLPDGIVQGMFHIAESEGFDPTLPWRLELVVPGASEDAPILTVSAPYKLPDRFVVGELPPDLGSNDSNPPVTLRTEAELAAAEAADATAAAQPAAETEPVMAETALGPDWRGQWRDQQGRLILLGASLAGLLLILSLQEAIVRRPRLHLALRVGFLTWTLVWIGWVASAQLSVIHVLNWVQSVREGVDWAFFLMEPLIFLLTAFVAISVILWGRAAFCGWLCPFGALQELLNRLAVYLRIPQIEIPHAIAERLKAVKYLIFIALVGLTFYAVELAYAATGVEPFKAAITFRFDAPWPAVLYAVVLLGIGLTVERFYCRFICPLGAGLAILGRFRMFDWLKRRAECGNPCSRCENVCPVRAIQPDGRIDMNECYYCLDCQVVYYDAHQCPPLIKRRKRREAAAPDLVHVIEPAAAPDR